MDEQEDSDPPPVTRPLAPAIAIVSVRLGRRDPVQALIAKSV
jgi:hypothetical protein